MTVGAKRVKENTAQPVRAVLRALLLLDALAVYPHGATPKALSAETGLHLSTTYHLLNTLLAAGYVTRSPNSRLFHLGPRIPRLQHGLLVGLQPRPALLPFLATLQQVTGETVHLGRLLGDDMVMVAMLAGSRPDAAPTGYLGISMPAHVTALGLVLLAWQPPAQIAAYLTRAPLTANFGFPGTTPARLRQQLEHTRAAGYALDPTGVAGCVAAPIFTAEGVVGEAISVVVPGERFEQDEARLINAAVTLARAASDLAITGAADPGERPQLADLAAITIGLREQQRAARVAMRLQQSGTAGAGSA